MLIVCTEGGAQPLQDGNGGELAHMSRIFKNAKGDGDWS